MKDAVNRYNDHLRRIILAQEQFAFTDVKELETLKYIHFDYGTYTSAKKLIEQGLWDKIQGLPDTSAFREYLEIVSFKDQNGNVFIATIYDSDALEQDPQIIDTFPPI